MCSVCNAVHDAEQRLRCRPVADAILCMVRCWLMLSHAEQNRDHSRMACCAHAAAAGHVEAQPSTCPPAPHVHSRHTRLNLSPEIPDMADRSELTLSGRGSPTCAASARSGLAMGLGREAGGREDAAAPAGSKGWLLMWLAATHGYNGMMMVQSNAHYACVVRSMPICRSVNVFPAPRLTARSMSWLHSLPSVVFARACCAVPDPALRQEGTHMLGM